MLLTLYMRSYCSLCKAMVEELQPYQERFSFELEQVDVDSDPELERLYGLLVPVLMAPEGEICHYFIDHEAVQRYFAGH